MIRTNKELSLAVFEAIEQSGVKRLYIAQKLGIQKESFARMLNKKSFSLDDANKILDILGYDVQATVVKRSDKN